MIHQFHSLEKLDKYIQQKSVCVCVCVCVYVCTNGYEYL